jgi:glycosyltransferase involved in cell wall biosynthesis
MATSLRKTGTRQKQKLPAPTSVNGKDTSRPVVSVILPTFNRLKYLRPAVESVFAQTFSDWELIIADDGSDEETRAFLATLHQPPRIKVISLSHTGNPSAVRNAAIHESAGEYIAFLDSDDLWLTTKLERQVAGLRRGSGRRWSYTGCLLIDAAGGPRPYSAGRQWIPYQGPILERLLANEPEIWTPAVLVERRLLLEVGAFDERLPVFEDYDLWLRLACYSDVDVIDEPLIRVRLHDQHYSGDGLVMLASRHGSLGKLRTLVADSRLRRAVEHRYAQSTLELANARVHGDRLRTAMLLAKGCAHAWRFPDWWMGLPRVLLKLMMPRVVLGALRAARAVARRRVHS